MHVPMVETFQIPFSDEDTKGSRLIRPIEEAVSTASAPDKAIR